MPDAAELRAALAVAELEEELVAAKSAGLDDDEYRDLKLRVRDARQAYRGQRSGAVPDGDAAVSPEPIRVSAEVKR